MPYARRRGCKCENKKKCKCGATWSFTANCGKDPVTGVRIQIPGSGYATKAEALNAAKEIELQYSKGTYLKNKKITFKELTELWIEFYDSTGEPKEGTIDVRRSAIKRLLKKFDAILAKDITSEMYQKSLFELKESGKVTKNKIEGLAYQTLISTHSTAKMIFEFAEPRGYININPTRYAKVPKTVLTYEESKEQALPKYLEKEELAKFLKTVEENAPFKDYVTFYTLSYTGMRIGELSVLFDSDLDNKEHSVNIDKTVYNGKCKATEFKLQKPKTKTSERVIEIDEMVSELIGKQISFMKEFKMSKPDVYYDKYNFIFANVTTHPGYPEHRNFFNRHFKKYLKMAGLNTDLTPHSLRHTHTSLLAEAGVTLETIMDRLGHKNDSTTRAIYLHVTKKLKKEAAQKFAELMDGI